ncbi:hypothetical protein F4861DRAFT_475877 [Xylaria intraflava]|nr:hypothetical protein F4861DRAFT_475877 [Xylaria intraflava]
MGESHREVISYDGEGLYVQVIRENEGWSILKPILSFSSVPSRAHRPASLRPSRTGVVIEDMGYLNVKLRLSAPTFDLGLGCFGHPSKIVDTGRGEANRDMLQWTDSYQIKMAWDLFSGKAIWSDDEWIDFQLGGSHGEYDASCTDVLDEGAYPILENRISGGQDLLEELDGLEAARPKQKNRRITIPGNREDIWEQPTFSTVVVKQHFEDWIDEVADLEASVSMPEGTRYYKVDDAEVSDN